MFLFVFEFLGTTELLVIAFVALIIFGPRKLPELGRSLGKSLGEFKRASEDFKRTWEREVEVEQTEREMRIDREARAARDQVLDADNQQTALPAASSYDYNPEESTAPLVYHTDEELPPASAAAATESQSIPRSTPATAVSSAGVEETEPPRKQDWL